MARGGRYQLDRGFGIAPASLSLPINLGLGLDLDLGLQSGRSKPSMHYRSLGSQI